MGLKCMNFKKGLKFDFICMKMKLMKNKKYFQQKFPRNVLVPETTTDFTSRVSKSYVPFSCKFLIVMHFVPILPWWCRSKTNIYVFSYDNATLKFWASFRFFLTVFIEKFQIIHYLNYVRKGIIYFGKVNELVVIMLRDHKTHTRTLLCNFVYLSIMCDVRSTKWCWYPQYDYRWYA